MIYLGFSFCFGFAGEMRANRFGRVFVCFVFRSEPEEERAHILDDLNLAKDSKAENQAALHLSSADILPTDLEKMLLVALKHLVTCNIGFQQNGPTEQLLNSNNVPEARRAEWRELFTPKLHRFYEAAQACYDFMRAKAIVYPSINWRNGIYIRHVSDGIVKNIPPDQLGPFGNIY